MKVQVPREHYLRLGYDSKARWVSYWHQIREVLETRPRNVLEVGIGNGTVSNYLRNRGLEVKTADIDPRLRPDFLVSVTELTKVIPRESFDTVLCAEVLEHIPFEEFEKALIELGSVSRRFVILSLPHAGPGFEFAVKLPGLRRLEFAVKLPWPVEHKFDGQHYWEIGKKGYPLRRVKAIIEKHFRIRKTYLVPGNSYHRIFVLERT